MKEQFKCYHPYTEDEYQDLWSNCIFTFDTSALLDLYRSPTDVTKKLLEILRKVKKDIWLSNQAAYGFYRNRPGILLRKDEVMKGINDLLEKGVKAFMDIERDYNKLREDFYFLNELDISNQITQTGV
jgi:hypothetical protein